MTGVTFGPDGALYLADWIEGWEPKKRGRIWKLDVPASAANPLRAETKTLIAADFKTKSVADLHSTAASRRHARPHEGAVRARRSRIFGRAARVGAPDRESARAHPRHVGTGPARAEGRSPGVARSTPFLKDGDAEIRAQAAKLLGDLRYGAAASTLVPMLGDASPRVRFFAAEALGRIAYRPAFQPIVAMLAANNEEDVYLRHAGALALSRIGPADAIAALSTNPSRGVRIAAVVALRRLKDAGVARFLADQDEYIVTEAARAINDDGGIAGALPQLAAALESKFSGEPFVRRAINANLRVGTAEAAQRVARYAGGTAGNDEMRAEAISVLGVWPKPSILDRVDGTRHRPDGARLRHGARRAGDARAADLRQRKRTASGGARRRSRPHARDGGWPDPAHEGAVGADRRTSASRRCVRSPPCVTSWLPRRVRSALQDKDAPVRMAALTAIPPLNLPEATTIELLSSVIGKGSIAEQQSALQAMGQVPGATGREAMTRLVVQMEEGKLAPEIQLDVAEAARATKDPALVARLDKLANRPGAKPVDVYADALRGGDTRRGARIVFQAPAAQCTRCHNFGGPGNNVGPNLSGVASRLTREQLLEVTRRPERSHRPGLWPGAADAQERQEAVRHAQGGDARRTSSSTRAATSASRSPTSRRA